MNPSHDRYEIIETIGTGVTSRVDKARDTSIGRTVALKTFLQGLGARDLQQQFVREAQIIGGLSHPNIIALYDVGTNKDGAPYLVMEYVDGRTLEAAIEDGRLPLRRAAAWAGDLATALGRAHRANIIHGDLKPANILVTRDGQVKLGDFGIAHFSTQFSDSGNLTGTPAYLSPEQILGHSQDTRSDIFSLGVILYQMTTGMRPFDGDSLSAVCAQIISSVPPPPPSQHNPSLPLAFDHLVMRCLAKDPADRYPTAEALAADVYPFARNKQAAPSQSDETSAQPAEIPWWSGFVRPEGLWTVAAGASLLLLITVVSTVHVRHNRSVPILTASAVTFDPSPVSRAAGTSPEAVSTSMISITPAAVVDSPRTDFESASTKPERQTLFTSRPSTLKNSRRVESRESGSLGSTLAVAPDPDASSMRIRPPADAPSANPQLAPAKQLAFLRIEIVSAISDETLVVYSGKDVLVSTRLNPGHHGEPLHFDCPLPPGSHPLHVALYRGDESLHLQKQGFAEIVSYASNTLGIRINGRSKLPIRKGATLEVNWPNPHLSLAQNASPLAPVSSSSK
jgi:serine/threonine protein kinase